LPPAYEAADTEIYKNGHGSQACEILLSGLRRTRPSAVGRGAASRRPTIFFLPIHDRKSMFAAIRAPLTSGWTLFAA
jgi:hypothetical protein